MREFVPSQPAQSAFQADGQPHTFERRWRVRLGRREDQSQGPLHAKRPDWRPLLNIAPGHRGGEPRPSVHPETRDTARGGPCWLCQPTGQLPVHLGEPQLKIGLVRWHG
jgi:hypothetical protein